MNEQFGIIYRAYDSEGKSYIGQTVKGLDFRKHQHETCNLQDNFHNALKEKEFQWETLEDNIPEEQLLERERYWVKVFDSQRNGYNGMLINCFPNCRKRGIESPGYGKTPWNKGKELSEEFKTKVSNNNSHYWKDKHLSEEHKKKLSDSHKGKQFSEEHRKNISNNNSRYWKGKTGVHKGKHWKLIDGRRVYY